jgi:hypothetical protein
MGLSIPSDTIEPKPSKSGLANNWRIAAAAIAVVLAASLFSGSEADPEHTGSEAVISSPE